MFKISAIQDKDTQKKYAELCGAECCPEAFAYSMIDDESGKLMGFSQFELAGGYGYIYDLKAAPEYSEDYEAMFILGRATMNFIDLCALHTCRAAKNAGNSQLLHAIGFRDVGEEYLLCDMTGMFDGNCDGKSK